MTINELRKKTDEELLEISLRKNKNGCATADADRAQYVRQERSSYWPGVARNTSQEATLNQERGTSGFVKRFK